MKQIRVGMSGWINPDWRGGFYPKGLPQKQELSYASQQVTSIEINGTFYSLKTPKIFQSWYSQVPADFCFAIKAPQFMTHVLRLKEVEKPLATFLASGLFCLKEKLGPILWQFPPNVTLKDDRFETFLKMLPHDSLAAAEVAKNHSEKIKDRAWLDPGGSYPIRHAFEFRHPSFMNPDFIQLLRAHNVAVVFAESGKKSPYVEDLTADFVYARMHGEDKKYTKGYTPSAINKWAEKAKKWAAGLPVESEFCVTPPATEINPRDVFIYFDTNSKKHAPMDALKLLKALAKPTQLEEAA